MTDQTKLTDRKTEDVANEEIKRELEGQKEQNSRLDAELDKCRMAAFMIVKTKLAR